MLCLRRRARDRAAVVALDRRARGRRTASTTRCCSARSPAWSCSRRAENLITLFVGLELLSIPLYVLCATELRRRTSLEAGLKYLVIGSVGSATLLYGLALDLRRDRRDATSTRSRRRSADQVGIDRPAAADRHRAGRDRAGLQGVGRAVPPVDARRLPGRAHADHDVHGGGDQGGGVRASSCGCSTRRSRLVAAPTGRPRWPRWRSSTIVIGNVGAIAQRSLKRHARLVGRRAGRLHAGRRGRGHAARPAGDGLLPRRLPGDERGRVRGGDRARAGVASAATTSPRSRTSARPSPGWRGR